MEHYRLSRFAFLVPLPGGQGIALHAANRSRVCLNPDLFQILTIFRNKETLSLAQLQEQTVSSNPRLSAEQIQQRKLAQRPLLEKVIQYFLQNCLLVHARLDEEALYRHRFLEEVESRRINAMEVEAGRPYQLADFVSVRDVGGLDYDSLDGLQVLILGGCLSQYSADALEAIGNRNGFSVRTTTSWLESPDVLDRTESNLVILQLSSICLLGPLWDGAVFCDELERGELLQCMKDSCSVTLKQVRDKIDNQLLLIHGFSRPMVSPLGIHDFRYEYSFERIVFELNEHIRTLIRNDPDVMYIDEERIVANFGKRYLLDDLVAPFSHHGPIDMVIGAATIPTRQETFDIRQPFQVARLLAQEYLDHYIAWQGLQRIKLIVVDLDDVLWPVPVGENGFDLDEPEFSDSLKFGVWAGIHQALKILKEKGVLLATASKNSHDVVMQEWDRLGEWCDRYRSQLGHVLRKDDFVVHEINWGPKSASITRILSSLETTDGATLFIDDHPMEREEVRREHPNIHVLGDDLNTVRGFLLTSPRLQFNHVSSESSDRTRMIKAQLTRVDVRKTAPSEYEFFSGLNVKIHVNRLISGASLGRVVELIQRTNQFNTTLQRFSAGEIEKIIRLPDSNLFTLEVTDRFGGYGVVGVCILAGAEIASFVMSCRVIGLRPAVPFLCTALVAHGDRPYHGKIMKGPRNEPCRSLFADAGFNEGSDGSWSLTGLEELNSIDAGVYEITLAGAGRDGENETASAVETFQQAAIRRVEPEYRI